MPLGKGLGSIKSTVFSMAYDSCQRSNLATAFRTPVRSVMVQRLPNLFGQKHTYCHPRLPR